ncbi:MAG: hypothetical protein PHQ52_05405 [Candidatus Omnitrophica bacterium]|nr:hypothetical protein [Candidatus Omnitrophota bacterium]
MIDKTLQVKIKATEEFIEYWIKLQDLYKQALGEKEKSKVNADVFFSTKDMVNLKFEAWMDVLRFSTKEKFTKGYCFYEIFSLEDIFTVSDFKKEKIADAWENSFIFIYGILARAKKKKTRLDNINGFFYNLKKIFNRGGK